MRAVVCTSYGAPDVLSLQEVAKPVPKEHEILVKIYATTVTSGDCRVRAFRCPLLYWLPMRLLIGWNKPRNPILGVELAGEVEAVGKQVKRFKPKDKVYAITEMDFGTYAEYKCLHEDANVTLMPTNATYEEAAVMPFGGTTALHFFRKGQLQRSQRILIYGASGSVGTSAVQLAKYFGAEVTGVCSTANVELVRQLGADEVIDYTKENFAQSGKQYDIVFDAVGKCAKSRCKQVLAPHGKYLTVEGQGVAKVRVEDMQLLAELMEAGQLRAVIDRRYPLEQIAQAHEYVEQGHKKGNVVITVADGSANGYNG